MAAVLVHIDLDGDRPHGSSLSALAAARMIASSWGATLYAAIVVQASNDSSGPDSTARVLRTSGVDGIDELEVTLARAGADRIVVAFTDGPVQPLWASAGAAWQTVLDHLRPRLILFGADAPSAVELGPRTAAHLGARLLSRARAHGVDDLELRDRDGVHARASDGGAAVASIGGVLSRASADPRVDVVVLATAGGADPRIELKGTSPAEIAHSTTAIVAIGDDVKDDAAVARDAARLATLIGASIVGPTHRAAVAPELCITLGSAAPDLAGATSVIRIGTGATKFPDGVLAGDVGPNLAELCRTLEGS